MAPEGRWHVEDGNSPSRRQVLGALASASLAAASGEAAESGMIYRPFGKSGIKVSAIGLGGSHIGSPPDENDGIRIIRAAVDRGITFLDNCWDYHDGRSEVVMGKALRDGYREKVFLMTKFDGRTKAATAKQIDESLRRLQTDHLDLIQFHENIRLEDPDRFFAPGGPVEAVKEAKQAGKVRFIGFTGHKDPIVHLRMLELAEKNNFHFDSAQMPLNVLDAHFRSFEKNVVPKLVAQGIAVLGMKPLAEGEIPRSGVVSAIEALHYAMSLPTTVVITGCETMERLDQALEAAKTFKAMSGADKVALLAKTRELALTGKLEKFKTSNVFDGTARNPQWMG
jgi:aryl-alcohol dehydrogenase-like predicted oxidoreductase